MNTPESLFLEAWKAGVDLSVKGDKLHFEASTKPSGDLLRRLKEHKPELLSFLSCWINTPHGEAKFWGFVGGCRCGVVLRHQPDRVTWIKRNGLRIKPSDQDKAAAVQ